jgi:hypothetical protein
MNRLRTFAALVVAGLLAGITVVNADVRTEQKTRFQLGGVLGRMVNMFGGRAAREGVTTTVAVKGDRKITMSDQTGQIIDLAEEKVYDLDIRGKKYKVTTFAELRRQMEEARKRATDDAKKEQERQAKEEQQASSEKPEKEFEVDFEIKNTGMTKTINGFETKQSLAIVTVREKGKTLEQSGGLVMTTDMWLAPRMASIKELADFDLRYAQKVYGPMVAGASPRDMASALAMYPQMKPALEKMAAEAGKVEGTPILTTVTMDAVKSAEQMAQEAKSGSSDSSSNNASPTSVGGLLGGLARRGAQRSQESSTAAASNRATFMTTTNEYLKITTDVTADAVAIPANFKLDK